MHFNYQPISNIIDRVTGYVIPGYQRSYRWTEDNVEELLQDIWGSCKRNENEYFLGSIICCTVNQDGRKIYEVVDGQQRLITITLIMRQLIDKVNDAGLKEDLSYKTFRSQGDSSTATKEPVLTVRKRDKDAFARIINGGKFPARLKGVEKKFVENTKMINAFFKEELGGDAQECAKFGWYLIGKVSILQVITGDDRSSSFRLFEVLNNRGMSLDPTDLLKNELMEKAHTKGQAEQEKKVEEQWEKLEDVVQKIGLGKKDDKADSDGKDLGIFFSVLQVSEKINRDRVSDDIYKHYARMLKEGKYRGDSVTMIGDILASAQRFYNVCNADSSQKTMSFFKGFYKNTREWAPAIMAFLNNKNYDIAKFPEFAELLEKVYVQQWFAGETASKREAPSYHAVVAINTGESFDDVMGILRKLADNDKMATALRERDFYEKGSPAKNNFIKLVLLRLSTEMGESDVQTEHVGDITVEHILPEAWTRDQYWKDRFTEDEYDKWLNKIGNLTVIGRKGNSKIKYRGFDVKKKDAYQSPKTVIAITNRLTKYEEWRVEELQDRHEELIEEIEKLWLIK